MGLESQAAVSVPATGNPREREVRRFMALALGLRFEMRYVHEVRWWPASLDEVAYGLAPYFDDLDECLDRLVEGAELGSRLSRYRLAPHAGSGLNSSGG